MRKVTREAFEQLANEGSGPGVPVAIEDGRMGLIAHWDDEGAQIEAYRGNDHECIRVPWGNVIETPIGLVVGLKGATREADGESYIHCPERPAPLQRASLRELIHTFEVEIEREEVPVYAMGDPQPPIVSRQERILRIGGEFAADSIDAVEINGQRFLRG